MYHRYTGKLSLFSTLVIIFILSCSFLAGHNAWSDVSAGNSHLMSLSIGEMKTLKMKDEADRINIGTRDVISIFMQDKKLLVVKGKRSGFTSLLLQYKDGSIERYDVHVAAGADLPVLEAQLQQFFKPIEGIEVKLEGDKIVVSGDITDGKIYNYYRQIVSMYGDDILDTVGYDEATRTDTIQIDVQIVQLQHKDSSDIGIEWFADGPWEANLKGNMTGDKTFTITGTNNSTMATGGNTSVNVGDSGSASSGTTASDDHGTVKVSGQIDIENVNFKLIALAKEGKAKFLATPKLIVQSGEKASFLVGGEIPIAQLTAFAGSVDWKKYGTQLNIAPVVVDNKHVFLSLKVTVSDLDFSTIVQGYPSIVTKEATTSVTMMDGQTFAIAGLLSDEVSDTVSKVPLLGDIPFIGSMLFSRKGKSYTKTETIIFITPHILRKSKPLGPDSSVVSDITPTGIMGKTISDFTEGKNTR